MIKQIWKDTLSQDCEGQRIASPDQLDEVVDLVVSAKIDLRRFTGNLIVLVQQAYSVSPYPSAVGERFPPTPSVHYLVPMYMRPGHMPMWFLAAFPDVAKWSCQYIDEINARSTSDDEAGLKAARLLGIDPAHHDDDSQSDLEDSQGCLRVLYCRNLIANYRRETGKPLETAFGDDDYSPDNFYLGFDLLDAMGQESNFTLIATNTTKYYMELRRAHAYCFPDETALIGSAGMLDAGTYILVLGTVAAEQITVLAKETEGRDDRLVWFCSRLASLLLSLDCPQVTIEEVTNACEEQADAIRRSVRRTMASYTGEPMVIKAVAGFMTASQFAHLRQAAGVHPPTFLDNLKGLLGG